MKMRRPHNIQKAIFGPYTLLFVFIFTLVMGYFIYSESNKIKESTFSSVKNSVSNISEMLDTEIQALDTVSQNIMYSNLIKQRFENYVKYNALFSPSTSLLERYNNEQNTRVLYDLLIAIIGPNRPVDQIYLYSLNYGRLGVGLDNSMQDISAANMAWYKRVYEASGAKVLFCGNDPTLDKYFSSQKNSNYISLLRVYFSSLNAPQGIVELKLSLKKIDEAINSMNRMYDESIYIYTDEGKLACPSTSKSNPEPIFLQIKESSANAPSGAGGIRTILKDNKYIVYKTSDYSGFTTAMVVDNDKLMEPIAIYVQTSLVLLLFVLGAASLLSYTIAKRIGRPLNRIYSEIKQFEITSDQDKEFSEIDTHITELNSLYKALQKMQKKAKEAMEKELELRNREIQSKILALQSQMNPHFLYNTLSTIQAMADENMNDEIATMCQSCARILRYISSNGEKLVPLSEEVSCVRDFLKTMELRHAGKLISKVNIPDSMLCVEIPKLCLQLIVENAIKFTTKQKNLPWTVEIDGHMDSDMWEISVTDNGPGFTEEEMSHLKEKISTVKKTGIYPDLELNGMGLMNVLIRLILLYKDQYIFRIENRDPHGAVITIGAFNVGPGSAEDKNLIANGDDA